MDDFRRGANEWGSKNRKAENPKCRAKLRRQIPKLLDEHSDDPVNACDAGTCDQCRVVAV